MGRALYPHSDAANGQASVTRCVRERVVGRIVIICFGLYNAYEDQYETPLTPGSPEYALIGVHRHIGAPLSLLLRSTLDQAGYATRNKIPNHWLPLFLNCVDFLAAPGPPRRSTELAMRHLRQRIEESSSGNPNQSSTGRRHSTRTRLSGWRRRLFQQSGVLFLTDARVLIISCWPGTVSDGSAVIAYHG